MSMYILCDDGDCDRKIHPDDPLVSNWYIPGDEMGDMCPEHRFMPSACSNCGGENMDELRCPDFKTECVYCCEDGGHDEDYPEENREADHRGEL